MIRLPPRRDDVPARFAAAPDLSIRDCVELAAALAAYRLRNGLARVEVSGPPAIRDLIEEFAFEGVRFVDGYAEPAVDIAAVPRTWRCGIRGLRCFGDRVIDAANASGEDAARSTLAEGTALRFARHDRLGDALGIVTGLEHFCRDNAIASVTVSGAPVLAPVVEVFACERVRYTVSVGTAVSGDAVFARSSWSMPWLDRFNHALADTFGGRSRHAVPPLPIRATSRPHAEAGVVYCQFDARSGAPPPQRAVRRILSQLAVHGEVQVLGGPDTPAYLGHELTYVRGELPELVARLLSCRLFVGCDSGLGHLAGCLGVPGLIVSTDDFETTWSFFRGYANLSVIPLAATELLLA